MKQQKKMVEPATYLSDEEFKEIERMADEFSRIGCTSFRMTPEEIKEILERQENA